MPTFLPELISAVLLRLPVKSLLRFRCLSTSFCAEIDSTDFVKNHLNRSIQGKTRPKLIITDEDIESGSTFYAADFDDGLKEVILLNKPSKSTQLDDTLVCNNSCNGLILLVIFFNDLGSESIKLALWNPFTRRCKSIPPSPVKIGSKKSLEFGLGHDSALDDYKIVMIIEGEYYLKFQVWIFSLKSNSWRRIKDLHLGEDDFRSCVCGFANGVLYWECKGKTLGFDVVNELFFNLPLLPNGGGTMTSLGPYNDSIAVLEDNLYISKIAPTYKTVDFYLRVNGKGGVKAESVAEGSWMKAFTIEEEGLSIKFQDVDFMPWPSAYSKDGDSILLYTRNEMFWYNLGQKTAQKVEIAGVPQAESFGFDVCWESLVSLDDDNAFDGAA
ncbi:hypothetical protein SLE2022_134010 [Rubroshorea leprosula]